MARQGNVSMAANKMVLRYDEAEVNLLTLIGGARITEAPGDTLIVGRDNWMAGMEPFVNPSRRNERVGLPGSDRRGVSGGAFEAGSREELLAGLAVSLVAGGDGHRISSKSRKRILR